VVIFYNPNITGAPTTVTANITSGNGSGFVECWATEYSGGIPQTTQDNGTSQSQTNPGTGTNAVTSGNFTTLKSGDLIYSATAQSLGTGVQPSAGTGFTKRNTFTGTQSTRGLASEDLVQGSAGSTAGTWTQTQATSTWITVAQGFTISSSGFVGGKTLLGVGK
jgi:hypothetical protein